MNKRTTYFEGQISRSEQIDNIKTVGINLLILALYSMVTIIVCDGGLFIAIMFIAFHFLLCTMVAFLTRKWIWALSGLVVMFLGYFLYLGVL